MTRIATVGHSTHSAERFLEMLRGYGITAIADVRSSPYSRHNPQFNRDTLKKILRSNGISYVFLGAELGARSEDPRHYDGDRVNYAKVSESEKFRAGLDRVISGAERHNVALMCAEKDPVTCHRTILVARRLIERGVEVEHILPDGSVETHDGALSRLMGLLHIDQNDLFMSSEALRDRAYLQQEEKIAYVKTSDEAEVE